jgi:hypothetical protein
VAEWCPNSAQLAKPQKYQTDVATRKIPQPFIVGDAPFDSTPILTSVTPNQAPSDAGSVRQTLRGVNFRSGSRVFYRVIGGATYEIQYPNLTYVSTGEMQVQATLGTTPAAWAVRVLNPDGQASPEVQFQVVPAGTPMVTSISPNPVPVSAQDQRPSVAGINFHAPATMTVSYPGGPARLLAAPEQGGSDRRSTEVPIGQRTPNGNTGWPHDLTRRGTLQRNGRSAPSFTASLDGHEPACNGHIDRREPIGPTPAADRLAECFRLQSGRPSPVGRVTTSSWEMSWDKSWELAQIRVRSLAILTELGFERRVVSPGVTNPRGLKIRVSAVRFRP